MKKQSAFTLAEVLITLGIIGVVATMTIPTLMSNTNKAEFKTGFKKMLSVLNQAVTMSVAVDYTDFADANSGTGEGSIYNLLTKRMRVARTVVDAAAANDSQIQRMFSGDANGQTGRTMSSTNITLFFSDGMVLSYPTAATNCTLSVVGQTGDNGKTCAGIVDVNGPKNPNKLSHCQYNAATGQSTTSYKTNDSTATAANAVGGRNTAKDGVCGEGNSYIGDQFSVEFVGQQVLPNGYAARYVLYDN